MDNSFRFSINLLSAALLIATLTLSSGCATLDSLTSQTVPITADSANGKYTVEMHTTFGKVIPFKGGLSGSTTVSEALAASGATKKYRSMEVEVLRVVEHEGRSRGLRMAVDFDPASKLVIGHQDYALVDGDRIVVKPSSNGSLVKMLNSMTGG